MCNSRKFYLMYRYNKIHFNIFKNILQCNYSTQSGVSSHNCLHGTLKEKN